MKIEIENLIKKIYYTNDFSIADYTMAEVYPNELMIKKIITKIKKNLNKTTHYYIEKNYSNCYWIEIIINEEISFFDKWKDFKSYLKNHPQEILILRIQISMWESYMAVKWLKGRIEGTTYLETYLFDETEIKKYDEFFNKIKKIFNSFKIQLLTQEELDEPVKWMKPGSTLQNTPTVYNCLFSEF